MTGTGCVTTDDGGMSSPACVERKRRGELRGERLRLRERRLGERRRADTREPLRRPVVPGLRFIF